MQVLDASSIIHAWDNYPINQFPGLWEWIAGQIEEGELTISEVAFDEVNAKEPECADWLKECEIEKIRIENDILIIATASVLGVGLISDERQQPQVLQNLSKSKIPKVCQMEGVGVHCSSFIDLIKRSEAVFR